MPERCIRWLLFFMCIAPVCFGQPASKNGYETLKQANNIFPKRPDTALKMLNGLYQYSLTQKNYALAAKSLNYQAEFYYQLNRDALAQQTLTRAISLARQYHIDSLAGDANVIMGTAWYGKGNFAMAINYYESAVKDYQKTKAYSRVALAYLDLGWAERKLGRFEIANQYYFKSIPLLQLTHDNENLADVLNGIGGCYSSLNNYPKSIEFYQRSLTIRKQLNDTAAIAESYNNLGYIYNISHKPDSAIFYLTKAIAIRKTGPDSSMLVLPLQNMGSALKAKGLVADAGRYINRSLIIAGNYKLDEETARGCIDLAEISTDSKNWPLALKYLGQAEKIAKRINTPEILMTVYDDKYKILEKTNNERQALQYYKCRDHIRDSLFTAAKSRDIDELDIKYQTRERQKTIALLNIQNQLKNKIVTQQRRFIGLLLGTAILLLVMFLFAWYNYRLKKQAHQRINLLMKDIHHRVKNNLQMLSGLFTIQIDNLSDDAAKNTLRENQNRLMAMNMIHNDLYNKANTQIEIKEYLAALVRNIDDSLNFYGVKLLTDLDEKKIEADKAVAIGLIINEMITNSFKHAFPQGLSDKCEVYINVKTTDDKLLLSFGDNGKGLPEADSLENSSFGARLIDLLCQQLGARMSVDNSVKMYYRLTIPIQ